MLHNPPLNIIDIPMMEELSVASMRKSNRARTFPSSCCSGEGKAFSAGVDVAAHTPDKVEEMLRKFHA